MNIIRRRVFKKYTQATAVYGSFTTERRKELNLAKTNYNDALAISGIDNGYTDTTGVFKVQQFRKKKCSLHEATAREGRKEPNRTARRNKKNTKCSGGYYLNDKVKVFGKIGFISGFTKGGAYVKDIENSYITMPGKNYKQVGFKNLEFLHHNHNWQFISLLKSREFLPTA